MSTPIQDLLTVLDLEPLEVNLFRGRSPPSDRQRVYGGQVIGQALVAACRTVDEVAGRPPHSLHAYFMLGGDPKAPIIYDVDRIRDGKSFTTRRVVAIQHGEAIFTMAVSFHRIEGGIEHQAQMPDVPAPDALAHAAERARLLPAMPEPVRRYTSARGRSSCSRSRSSASREKLPAALPCLDARDRQAAGRSGDPPMRRPTPPT
jgi:acyl-CoA thioesterase-2